MGSFTFWWIATIMVVAATAAVVLPLYLRLLPNYQDRTLLRRLMPAAGVAAAIPASGLALYALLGSPGASMHAVPPPPEDAVHHMRAAQLAGRSDGGDLTAVTARLRERLAAHPDDPDGWRLLAESYDFQGRAAEAAEARSHVDSLSASDLKALADSLPATNSLAGVDTSKLIADAESDRRARNFAAALTAFAELERRGALNADLWADYADARGAARGGLDPVAAAFIDHALALDPKHTKALWLKGSWQTESRDFSGALGTWRTLAQLLPPASSDAKLIAANIEEARAAMANSSGISSSSSALSSGGATVRGVVMLAKDLRSRVSHDAVLFVFAKSADEAGPPLAVLRVPATGWPVRFVLDDSAAMMPARTLSKFARVIVEARVSNSGSVNPAAGDLHAASGVIDPHGAQPLELALGIAASGGS